MDDQTRKTTVTITVGTWRRLSNLKKQPGESFDELINRLIDDAEKDSNKSPREGSDDAEPL